MKKVVIIGAGINGLCVALKLAHKCKNEIDLTIVSDAFTPNTTGDIAAGLWGPYLLGHTPESKIYQWSLETHQLFHHLWKSGFASECGICLFPVIELFVDPNFVEPFWKDIVFGYKRIDDTYLQKISNEHGIKYQFGIHYLTFSCEPSKFMAFIMEKLRNFNTKFEKRLVDSFNEFSEFDLVINCTGLGSKELVKDNSVFPSRGQVIKMKVPWCYFSVTSGDYYIIPNTESIVLGGTHQDNDFNLNSNEDDKRKIQSFCFKIMPSLKSGQFIQDAVGLRPSRNSVRLEIEILDNSLPIIHNYGHGGSGITMTWGCANEVFELCRNLLKIKPNAKL